MPIELSETIEPQESENSVNLDADQDAKLTKMVKGKALELGFERVGIAPVQPSAFKQEYRSWIAGGYAADMDYLKNNIERRLNPSMLLAEAKSIVAVMLNYYTGPDATDPPADRALFARYARGTDYHLVIEKRLKTLARYLSDQAALPVQSRVYVDTGPILEREVAQRAGLGWFGKNTMLINTRLGSYFLLGEIITTASLVPDRPASGGCGTCTKCMDACPTDAIIAPYQLDSGRCISYLTIEHRGPIPEHYHRAIGNHVFGCDICQEVCPFNVHRAAPTADPKMQPRDSVMNRSLAEIVSLSEDQYRDEFKQSAVKRAKWADLRRNAMIGLRNLIDSSQAGR